MATIHDSSLLFVVRSIRGMSDAQHTGRVNDIVGFTGTAKTVTGGGKEVCAWDEAGALVFRVEADRYEVDHVLAHSSGCVVSSGSFGTVAVLEGATGAVRHEHTHEDMPPGALFELPDGLTTGHSWRSSSEKGDAPR